MSVHVHSTVKARIDSFSVQPLLDQWILLNLYSVTNA